jgi:hypothetical protein
MGKIAWCSAKHDCSKRFGQGWNTFCFIKEIILRISNEAFIFDNAIGCDYSRKKFLNDRVLKDLGKASALI